MIGLNVLNVLALAVDTAMIGRMEEADHALTGLGFATQLIFLVMVAMMGLSVGTIAFVSRAHGAENPERVNHVVYQSSLFAVLVGLAVAVFGNLTATPLLTLLGATEVTMGFGLEYLRVMLTFAAINYLNVLYGGVLRAVGNTRLPFQVALASNALNVFLNYGLILGNYGLPALGVTGAAIGTVCSQAFAVVTTVYLLRRGAAPGLRPDFTLRPPDWQLARDLYRVGAPAALDMVIFNAGFLTIIGMLGRISQAAVAAHGVGLRIQALAFVPGMSVSQATGAMVGNALGAQDIPEAKRILRAATVLCTAIMSTLAATIIFFAPPIVQLFDVDPSSTLGQYAVEWMILLGSCMPIVGVWIAFVGLFQGAGDTRTTLRINAIATLALQIPLSGFLGFVMGYGAWGVWAAFPISFVLKASLAWIAYRRGRWARVGERV